MSIRNIFSIVIFGILLILVKGSVLAGEPQIIEKPSIKVVTASPGANAPWINREIDTPGDTGQYTSIAIDPANSGIYISYYDATNQELRVANSLWIGQKCDTGNGPFEGWGCLTVDSGVDVGKYSSIAVDPTGGFGIAYHDATNGQLKYIHFDNPHLSTYSIFTIDKGIPTVSTTYV